MHKIDTDRLAASFLLSVLIHGALLILLTVMNIFSFDGMGDRIGPLTVVLLEEELPETSEATPEETIAPEPDEPVDTAEPAVTAIPEPPAETISPPPAPVERAPSPVQPPSARPAPVQPAPVQPAPVQPAPVQPAPVPQPPPARSQPLPRTSPTPPPPRIQPREIPPAGFTQDPVEEPRPVQPPPPPPVFEDLQRTEDRPAVSGTSDPPAERTAPILDPGLIARLDNERAETPGTVPGTAPGTGRLEEPHVSPDGTTSWSAESTDIKVDFDESGVVRRLIRRDPLPQVPQRLVQDLPSETTVKVNFTLRPDGIITDLIVSPSSGYPALDQEVLRAVRQWMFDSAPAATTRSVQGTIVFEFRIR